MIIIGLTGSIAMGKTETGLIFKRKKIPVFDADLEVKKILNKRDFLNQIRTYFPAAIKDSKINKEKLAEEAFSNKIKTKTLEGIIHPEVKRIQNKWLRRMIRERHSAVVFDIPLLLETKSNDNYDVILVVSAKKNIQKTRVLKREGWDEKRFKQILDQQLSDKEKRLIADIIIETDRGKHYALKEVEKFVLEYVKRAVPRPTNIVLNSFA